METPSEVSLGTPAPWSVRALEGLEVEKTDRAQHHFECFKKIVLEDFGGPAQYLRKKLETHAAQQEFTAFLWQQFPLAPDLQHQLSQPVPEVEVSKLGQHTPVRVHVAMLGFLPAASLKPDPVAHSAGLLVQHILSEGFLSGEGPLLCKVIKEDLGLAPFCPWREGMLRHQKSLGIFSLGYTKGMLRACTLLSLLHMWMDDGAEESFMSNFPHVMKSCQEIFVHFVSLPSAQEEIFHNFRMSLRGSIRRPPNLLTWVGVLQALKQHGYEDSGEVIARFNGTVARQMQLQGSKAVAIGNLMTHFPADLLQLLTSHASKHGWESCALSDDNLSTKKVLPVFVFKSPHKTWKRLCAGSPEASRLCFQRVIADFEKQTGTRRKPERNHVEQLAEMACLVVNLSKELQEQFPLKMATIQTEIFDKWIAANPGLDLELHEVMSEKRANLSAIDVNFFRMVADLVQTKAPVTDTGVVQMQLTQLDQDKYQLTCKQLEYDVNAFRIYKDRLESVATAVHHAKVEWRKKAQDETAEWVRSWLAKRSHIGMFEEKEDCSMMRAVQQATINLLRSNGINKTNTVTCHFQMEPIFFARFRVMGCFICFLSCNLGCAKLPPLVCTKHIPRPALLF